MKIESIIEPNEDILELQKNSISDVKDILFTENVEAVGGMAVPMIGRPELDILVISKDIEGDADKLEAKGFMYRTPDNGAIFLKKKVDGVEVAVQIYSADNPMIEKHRKIIDLMRNNNELRESYEDFKRTLDGMPRDEYKKAKIKWMKQNILPKLGLN